MKLEAWSAKLRFGRSDLVTLLLSIITGVMIWVYVDSRRTEERVVKATLELGIPPGWKLDDQSAPPATVRVSLRGPRTVMGALKSEDVRFYRALELPAGASSNQEIHIELTRDDLRGLPRDVSVIDIPEPTIKMRLVRPVRRYVPVEVQTKGDLAKGFSVKAITFSPEYVAVYAPAEEFSGADAAKTVPVNLAEKTESFGTYVDLEPLKLKHNNIVLEDPVFVQVEVVEKIAQQRLEKVPVGILLATPMEKLAGGKLIPSQVTVVVEGGEQAVSALAANSVNVYIDTKEMGSSVQGEYTLRCRTLAPAGIKVLSVIPEEVRWVIPTAGTATPAENAPAPVRVPPLTRALPPAAGTPTVNPAGKPVAGIVTKEPAATGSLPAKDEDLPSAPGDNKVPAAILGPQTKPAAGVKDSAPEEKAPPAGMGAPAVPAGSVKPAR